MPPGVLPDQGHHGWRYAGRGPDGKLYVAIGAPCNVCARSRASKARSSGCARTGTTVEIFARGVRNSVGFDWHPVTGEMFFTDNGGEDLGDDLPPGRARPGAPAGPALRLPLRLWRWDPLSAVQGAQPGAAADAARACARGAWRRARIDFYRGGMFPEDYRNDALLAQHGSWNRSEPTGYRIMRVRFSPAGQPQGQWVFIDGWLGKDGSVSGRPVDLEELPDGSLLISDDDAGLIYRVTYQR